jgi:hypothetical protein
VVSENAELAARWRALAAEARATAERMSDAEAKLIVQSIAEGYERLAQRAEARKGQENQDSVD